jgi:hypothetical protein
MTKAKPRETTGNGPGKGKHSVSTTLRLEVLEALDYLASESGMKRGAYVAAATTAAVLAGTIFPRTTGTGKIAPEKLRKARKAAELDQAARSQR